jgi:ABC-type nitrate/sulfonate/bicarbonate transport system substrate-binding protein
LRVKLLNKYSKIAAVILCVVIIVSLGVVYYNNVYLPSIQPKTLQSVTIMIPTNPADGYWVYQYANDSGIYAEEGLQVQLTPVRTTQEMIQAVIGGDADGCTAIGDSFRAILAGDNQLRVVLALHRTTFGCIVRPEINQFTEVKSWGFIGRGSDGEVLTDALYQQQGINPDTLSIQALSFPAVMPALLAGQIDATPLGMSAYAAINASQVKMLFRYADSFPQYANGGLVVTQDMITNKPEVVKALVESFYRSQIYIMNHKEESINWAVNQLKIDRGYATFIYETEYTDKYGTPIEFKPDMPFDDLTYTMQTCANYMGVSPIPIQNCTDATFLTQVKNKLG